MTIRAVSAHNRRHVAISAPVARRAVNRVSSSLPGASSCRQTSSAARPRAAAPNVDADRGRRSSTRANAAAVVSATAVASRAEPTAAVIDPWLAQGMLFTVQSVYFAVDSTASPYTQILTGLCLAAASAAAPRTP